MKYRKLIVILALLVVAVATMIFLFSSESAEESSKTSANVVEWLLKHLTPGYEAMSLEEKRALKAKYQEPVRKAAHGTEFMLLGLFLYLFLHGIRARLPALFAWIAGTLYACSDEWHQTLVTGRGGVFQDVCIDSGGVIAGILLGVALLAVFHHFFPKKPEKA